MLGAVFVAIYTFDFLGGRGHLHKRVKLTCQQTRLVPGNDQLYSGIQTVGNLYNVCFSVFRLCPNVKLSARILDFFTSSLALKI